MLEKILEAYYGEPIQKADGLDDAVIGIDTNSNHIRLIYSVTKCIEITMKDMSEEEAIEHLEFNTFGAYVGEQTPIWCYDNFLI